MKPLYVKHPFIKMVNEASLNNDIHGADYQITVRKDGHQYVIPLQLKSSRGYQQEHKKKFPRIPSIVWNAESSLDLTEKKVIDIIYAYIMYKKTNNIHYILHETAIVT